MGEHNIIFINPGADFWVAPLLAAPAMYEAKEWSTPLPLHPLYHEVGHLLQRPPVHRQHTLTAREMTVASSISMRAMQDADEFVAELFVGLICDVQYDSDIMRMYARHGGVRP
jgi:hypothetical protein